VRLQREDPVVYGERCQKDAYHVWPQIYNQSHRCLRTEHLQLNESQHQELCGTENCLLMLVPGAVMHATRYWGNHDKLSDSSHQNVFRWFLTLFIDGQRMVDFERQIAWW
jgi:hypothetical protein